METTCRLWGELRLISEADIPFSVCLELLLLIKPCLFTSKILPACSHPSEKKATRAKEQERARKRLLFPPSRVTFPAKLLVRNHSCGKVKDPDLQLLRDSASFFWSAFVFNSADLTTDTPPKGV